MKLRLITGAVLFVIWVGCGGAFTTSDQGSGGSGPGGSNSSGGGAGSSGTGMGTGGIAGSQGVGGSFAGSNGVGGSVGGGGGSSTGGAAGRGGASVDAGVDFTTCDGPGQCVAVQTGCCGVCGTPEAMSFIGLNTKYVQAYHQEKCPMPVPCPACVQGKNPNIAARCETGHCQVFDVRKVPEYSSCEKVSDCHLRAGLGCCVCGGPDGGWVSVNGSGEQAISMAMCAPMTGCAACVPVPPANYAAYCNTTHVCGILIATN